MGIFQRRTLAIGAVFLSCATVLFPFQSNAVPVQLITETDPGIEPDGVALRSYNSLSDLRALNQASSTFLSPNIGGPAIRVAALTYDGNQFHMITEAEVGVGFEVVRIRSFNSLADLKVLNQASTSVLSENIGGSGIRVAGLTYDGNQFHMITEAEVGIGFETVRIRTFNTLADLKALNQFSTSVLGPNIGGSGIGVAGLGYDGSKFHMLTEAEPGIGFETVRIRTFNTLADLKALNQFSTSVIGPNIGGMNVSVAGFEFMPEASSTLPEPGTLILFGVGLAGLGIARRKLAS